MEFLADSQCCTKCLKKGIRVPYLEHRAHFKNGRDHHGGRPGYQHHSMRWCRACWLERDRRSRLQAKWHQQRRLRWEEWERRALMSKEERKQTPMVHIPVGRIAGPNKGKLRHPLTYLGMYGRYRSRFFKRLLGEPINYGGRPSVPVDIPKKRHNVLPTS